MSSTQTDLKNSIFRACEPSIDDLCEKLNQFAPSFLLRKEKVTILTEPKDFYNILKTKISNAKKRIFLCTLYIGKSEYELVSYTILHQALSLNPNLKVSILMDALRGTREAPFPTSASLLAPLILLFGKHRVDISMYHTPNLSGLKKKMLPSRINECWGIQHMKIYGFDDEVMLANLSYEYFTNRQDRYYFFSSPQLTDFYAKIHQFISSISYKVVPTNFSKNLTLVWSKETTCPEPSRDPKNFRKYATSVLSNLLKPTCTNTNETFSTIIYPLFQFSSIFKPYDLSTEKRGLCLALDILSSYCFINYDWVFTSGYFNIHQDYSKRLLSSNSKGCANGFYNSSWPSKMIPSAYSFLAQRFLLNVHKASKQDNIHLEEWKNGCVGKGGWSYHAKGLWIMPTSNKNTEMPSPYITLIGSSNFSYRSQALDLETTAFIITFDTELQKSLKDEVVHLRKYSKKIDMNSLSCSDRKIGWFVKLCVWLLEKML
ncbi:hypothetical protein PCANB_000030 [Pneumocystis canis]|nr:hypothetical protein PCANB_000030 [Pneumocystis canis]